MRGMKRRTLLQAPLALTPLAAWADLPKVDNLADALRWLDRVAAAKGARTTGAWPLPAVLEHLAQSIEMSLDGYPQPRSALFQNTLGAAAFAVFQWRGRMTTMAGMTSAAPLPPLPSRFWADLSTRDFAALQSTAKPRRLVAVLPVAAIEQHGPHLPLSVDATLLQGVIDAALPHLLADVPVLFLPPQVVGLSTEHMKTFPARSRCRPPR
jgi:hypothetical protein